MKLLILFGPPSVGKTTVGKIVEAQTNFKLFHNHMAMDGVMHIFGVGTPAEDRLSRIIRTSIIQEAAGEGIDLIFTYVWDFGRDKGKQNIDTYKQIYEAAGGKVYFVELSAPLETRILRANNPDRRQHKAYAPNSVEVAAAETRHIFASPQPFFYPERYLRIETMGKTPEAVAAEIISYLD